MSATFEILKPINGVKYTGTWYDQFSRTEILKAFDTDDEYILNGPNGEAFNVGYQWSDSGYYDVLDFRSLDYGLDRSEGRYIRKLEKMNLPVTKGIRNKNMPYVIVPVTQIAYAQGWFVSNKFLRRRNPVYVATTKQEMMNFFRRYGKIPKQKEIHQFTEGGYVTRHMNDRRLIETMDLFESVFEQDCIFLAQY
ncbi:MAG: hypothetical protein E7K14_01850 [Bacillota bacterium]|nr:hypothetical protein [Bacillota bacterium]